MKSEITNKVSNFNVSATNKNSFAQDFSLTQRSHPSVEEVKTAEKLAKSKKRAINDTEKTADVPLGGNRSLQVTSWCEYNNEADAKETSLANLLGTIHWVSRYQVFKSGKFVVSHLFESNSPTRKVIFPFPDPRDQQGHLLKSIDLREACQCRSCRPDPLTRDR